MTTITSNEKAILLTLGNLQVELGSLNPFIIYFAPTKFDTIIPDKEARKAAVESLYSKKLVLVNKDEATGFQIGITKDGFSLIKNLTNPKPTVSAKPNQNQMTKETKTKGAELAREVLLKSGKSIEALGFVEMAKIATKCGVKYIGISRTKVNNQLAAVLLTDKGFRGEYIDETSVTKDAEADAKETLKGTTPVATPIAKAASNKKEKAPAKVAPAKAIKPKKEKADDVTKREKRPQLPKAQTIKGQELPNEPTVKALKEREDVKACLKKSKNMAYSTQVWLLHDTCKLTFVECAYVLGREDRVYHAFRAIKRYKANPALQGKIEG